MKSATDSTSTCSGSLMALLFWLYRRQRKAAVFHSDEILSLL
ncbi:MAG: hypothetical protein ACYDBZ_05445 [Steroidobacteraceae bacterium]